MFISISFKIHIQSDFFSSILIEFMFCRTHLKTQESERLKLLSLKDAYEKKEIEWNKESSELHGQLIELTESNVSVH